MDQPAQWQDRNSGGQPRSHTTLPKLATRWTSTFDTHTDKHLSPSKQSLSTTQQQQQQPSDSKHQQQQQQQQPSSPDHKHSSSKHHLHRRHHRHHHTRSTIQSAVQLQNPFSFENPLRRSHHNNNSNNNTHPSQTEKHQNQHVEHAKRSTDHPRPSADTSRASSDHPRDPQSPHPHLQHPEAEDAVRPLRRLVRPQDVVKERKRRELRAQEVDAALGALSRDAHTATRKLDDTYYALLERLVVMKSTLVSLEEVSAQAREARTGWGREAGAVGEEVEGKIEGFEGFGGQDAVVEGLVLRLRGAKRRAGELEGRLEGCRGRLEDFQRKEEEARVKVHKRWWIFWIALAGVGLFVLMVVLWRQRGGGEEVLHDLKEKGEGLAREVGLAKNKSKIGLRLVDGKWEKAKRDEERKWDRLLDEL